METCKYGSGADKRKPTAVKRKGVVYRAYRLSTRRKTRRSTASTTFSRTNPVVCDETIVR